MNSITPAKIVAVVIAALCVTGIGSYAYSQNLTVKGTTTGEGVARFLQDVEVVRELRLPGGTMRLGDVPGDSVYRLTLGSFSAPSTGVALASSGSAGLLFTNGPTGGGISYTHPNATIALGQLHFFVGDAANPSLEKMTLTSRGSLGIGTQTPADWASLHVVSMPSSDNPVRIEGTADDGAYEWVGFHSGANSRAGLILWDGAWNGCTADRFCIFGESHQLMLQSIGANDVLLDDSVRITSRLRTGGNTDGTGWNTGITGPLIQRAGNVALAADTGTVLVGTTTLPSPAPKLHVNGELRVKNGRFDVQATACSAGWLQLGCDEGFCLCFDGQP